MAKIMFTGGGSGGHVIPNIALAQMVKDKASVHYLCGTGMERQLLEDYPYITLHSFNPPKFKRQFALSNLKLPFEFARACKKAEEILKEVKPDVLFSKGGYVSLPAVWAAHKLGIICVGHESDSSIGLAHRLCLNKYHRFFTAYPLSSKKTFLFRGTQKTLTVQVGALLRQSIYEGKREKGLKTLGFSGNRPILLAMGGSLGAQSLNEKIYQALPLLTPRFDVFLICGKGKEGEFKQNAHFHIAQYINNIADVYACSDVCVTRGGANALAELAALGVPFLAVPLAKASRKEQSANANYYVKGNGALCIEEGDLSEKNLSEAVFKLYENKEFFKKSLLALKADGTKKVADYLLSLL